MSQKYDIVIVGAGASGLVAGICASESGAKVCILEKLAIPGKKITATGNGKCNILADNTAFGSETVNSTDEELALKLIKSIEYTKLISFFEKSGIYVTNRNGYWYPRSLQASTVRDTLERVAREKGCRIICDCEVTDVKNTGNGFLINNSITADKLIISCGGCSSPKLGSNGDSFRLLDRLGINHTSLYPSLVGLKVSCKYLKTIEGVRHYGTVTLLVDGTEVSSEYGEFIFNKTGVSGIPVMNCSGEAMRALSQKKKVAVRLSVLTKEEASELKKLVRSRYAGGTTTVEQALTGIANSKLIYALLVSHKFQPDMTYRRGDDSTDVIIDELAGLTLDVTDSNGYENSQVTKGGVRLTDIDIHSMETKSVKGLYITGEALDVDCRCGGNNLTFAWITGILAGFSAVGKPVPDSFKD